MGLSSRLVLAGTFGIWAPAAVSAQDRTLALRVAAGGHSNVFLADTAPVGDVFAALEAEGDGEWAWEKGQLLVHGVGSVTRFRDRSQADEYFGFADAWLSQRPSPSLALYLADFVTAFDLRLLDRQGELLPGGRLRLLGNEAMAGLEWRVGSRTYIAIEALYRSRNYEERDTLASIDSGEPRAGFRLTRTLPDGWSLSGEAYFGIERYAELRARPLQEPGPPFPPGPPPGPMPATPELEIERREAAAIVQRRWGDGWRLKLSYELRLARDRFRGFQSYDQHGGEASLFLRPDVRTLLQIEVHVTERRFEHQPVADDEGSPLRRERFWTLEAGVEWPVADLSGARLAFLGSITATRKISNAPDASFDFVRGSLGTGLWF